MFEQSRSARFILMPAVQTKANLEAVSPELAQMIMGNTWTKLYFKLGTQESAEEAGEFIGKEIRITRSLSVTDSRSETANLTNSSPSMSSGDSSGLAYGEREQEEYRVSPDDLKSLGKGECIAVIGGNNVFPIKIPLIRYDAEFKKKIGKARLNHKRPRKVKGLGLMENVNRFLSNKDQADLKKQKDEE
jgi:type IV secretory pathway TraG/TraD family ATPase VirD4